MDREYNLEELRICDARPMMADVVSGAVPRPQSLAGVSNVSRWLRRTPAWRNYTSIHDLRDADWRLMRRTAPTKGSRLHSCDMAIVVELRNRDTGEMLYMALNEDGCGFIILPDGRIFEEFVDKRIPVLLTQAQHEHLRRRAFEERRPMAELIRELIDRDMQP